MLEKIQKISHLLSRRAITAKNDLLLKLRKISNINLVQLESDFGKNNFHYQLLELIQSLFGLPNKKIHLAFNTGTDSKEWTILDSGEIFNLPISSQIRYLASDNQFFIEEQNPIYSKIINAFNLPGTKKIFIFQLFESYTYIILFKNFNASLAQNLIGLETIVVSIGQKFSSHISYVTASKKIYELKSQLSEAQGSLRQTERLLKKRAYEIHNLIEISNELYSILNFDQLINSALLTLVGQLSCQKTFAMMYNSEDRRYSIKFTKGFNPDHLDHICLESDHPMIGHLLKYHRPHYIHDLQKSARMRPDAQKLRELEIEIIAPLIHHDRLKGFIGCGSKLYDGKFDNADLQIFSILTNIISISISNSQMYEDAKQMSFTDAMTNLNNYRYFENRLIEEINRCRRNDTTVSLIMLDIDFFKNYNDKLGHQTGDEALRTVGWILKNTVRDGDIVNRYGGEEFAIILPGMEKSMITILAERIRAKVEEYPFYKEHVQPGGSLTVSLGGATFPTDADSFESLVKRADQALYYSKNKGRNFCTIFSSEIFQKM
jgi:diguanylate cyclase (GGDEF)-like protein